MIFRGCFAYRNDHCIYLKIFGNYQEAAFRILRYKVFSLEGREKTKPNSSCWNYEFAKVKFGSDFVPVHYQTNSIFKDIIQIYFWHSADHVDLPPSPRIFDNHHKILGCETYIHYYPYYFLRVRVETKRQRVPWLDQFE